MTRSTCIALAIAVLTCTSSARKAEPRDEHRGDEAAAGSGEPSLPTPAGGGTGSNRGSMASPFKAALQRFQHEVASAYGKRASDLKIMPPSEDIIGFLDDNIGDLIAFEATAPELRVRGFASKDAVVLAKRNEFGPLFQAAHALDPGAAAAATDVARRIVFALGPEYRLIPPASYPRSPKPAQLGPPSLQHDAQGAVLRFYYVKDDPMPGAPATPFAAEVKCSADYKAALVSTSP
jgi:hypothetical protein